MHRAIPSTESQAHLLNQVDRCLTQACHVCDQPNVGFAAISAIHLGIPQPTGRSVCGLCLKCDSFMRMTSADRPSDVQHFGGIAPHPSSVYPVCSHGSRRCRGWLWSGWIEGVCRLPSGDHDEHSIHNLSPRTLEQGQTDRPEGTPETERHLGHSCAIANGAPRPRRLRCST